MGKKKAVAKKAVAGPVTNLGRPKGETSSRESFLHMRGSAVWVGWVRRLAKFQGIGVTALMSQALTELARRVGFREDPPPRTLGGQPAEESKAKPKRKGEK